MTTPNQNGPGERAITAIQGAWASRPHRSNPVGGTPTLLETPRPSPSVSISLHRWLKSPPISYLLSSIFLLLCSTPVHANQPRPEPGLERAVNWKWWVVPSVPTQPWSLPPQKVPVLIDSSKPSTPGVPPAIDESLYTVKKGDVLVRIARRFKISVAQLKEFNDLQSDFLQIGQQLRIPNPEELAALRSTAKKAPGQQQAPPPGTISEVLLLRVFLDNQGFSTGPITDTPDSVFGRSLHLYQNARGETLDHPAVVERARSLTPEPLTNYTLRVEDFNFIAPPKASAAPPSGSKPSAKPAPTPPPSYDELISPPLLAYRSPWEFVAERFRCDEKFLRKLNARLPTHPPAGSIFRVPNVAPFEIEKIPARQIQPSPDPSISAVIRDLIFLEIYKNQKLVAVMPLSRARPGLRGRGEWKILDAIPRPRLATIQEPRIVREEKTGPFYVNPNPTPRPASAVLAREQFLPAGPNNPVGVVWINLARAGEKDPLSFGLHGTSTPSEMFGFQSLGGFRLSNWDILRAASLLPPGTPLQWLP
jgi:LysM repeat protein